jgi:uncharacterized protein (TIGR02246 family)
MTDDETAIRELVDAWMDASKSGDLATVLGLMTDDAIFMTPGREPFGKEEFKANAESMRGIEMDGRAEVREIQVLGNWAWIRNRIEIEMGGPGATRAKRSGYTLTILKKGEDGRWRLLRDANLVS